MVNLQVARLPVSEKLELMESLWDALRHEPPSSSAIPSWHQDVLSERLACLDRDEEPVSDWRDARNRIRRMAENP